MECLHLLCCLGVDHRVDASEEDYYIKETIMLLDMQYSDASQQGCNHIRASVFLLRRFGTIRPYNGRRAYRLIGPDVARFGEWATLNAGLS